MNKFMKVIGILFLMSAIAVTAISQTRLHRVTKFLSNVETYQRYAWYHQTSDRLRSQRDSVNLLRLQHVELYEQYNGHPYSHWMESERERFQRSFDLWRTSAVAFNKLAAEYNTRMQDEQYPFTDTKSLPADIGKPLPRGYKQFMIPKSGFHIYIDQ